MTRLRRETTPRNILPDIWSARPIVLTRKIFILLRIYHTYFPHLIMIYIQESCIVDPIVMIFVGLILIRQLPLTTNSTRLYARVSRTLLGFVYGFFYHDANVYLRFIYSFSGID